MVDYKAIGQRIKRTRIKQMLTQEILAERCEITIEYLSKIENGKAKPTIDTLGVLCKCLNVDMGELFSGVIVDLNNYKQDEIFDIIRKCRPEIRPIAIELMRKLSEL